MKEIAHLAANLPTGQVWFNKQATCVNDPYGDVWIPSDGNSVDYEGELALVIGRRCRRLELGEALSVVAGYMICNDLSIREWQMRSPTATLGKSFDTHGPIGPWLTTADEIADPSRLSIRTWVNGELRQDGCTSDMIHDLGQQLVELSRGTTLEVGDVISTGTPAGVGLARTPPAFLKIGDVVRVEIEGLGHIENTCVTEPR